MFLGCFFRNALYIPWRHELGRVGIWEFLLTNATQTHPDPDKQQEMDGWALKVALTAMHFLDQKVQYFNHRTFSIHKTLWR